MTEDQAPPTPLPPAAQSPYPAHPAPHAKVDEIPVAKKAQPAVPGIGALGLGLIGGALAAVGLAVAIPFFRGRSEDRKPPRAPRKAPARKRSAAARKRSTTRKAKTSD